MSVYIKDALYSILCPLSWCGLGAGDLPLPASSLEALCFFSIGNWLVRGLLQHWQSTSHSRWRGCSLLHLGRFQWWSQQSFHQKKLQPGLYLFCSYKFDMWDSSRHSKQLEYRSLTGISLGNKKQIQGLKLSDQGIPWYQKQNSKQGNTTAWVPYASFPETQLVIQYILPHYRACNITFSFVLKFRE